MTKSTAHFEGILEANFTDIPEIVATTLAGLGYSSVNINNQYRQATARDRISEQYGTDRWEFDYRATVKWERMANSEKATVKIQVTEQKYSHQQHACAERCRQFWSEVETNASQSTTVERINSGIYGSARWATAKELEEAGYFGGESDSTRFVIGRYDGKIVSVPENLTHEHVLVCGPTGAGKTRTIFIPNLIRRTGISALVTEAASGEQPPPLYTNTAGYRASKGHIIHYFNPYDLTSTRINPLDAVHTFDDALHITNLIIRNTTLPNNFGGDQIWEQSETYLLNALVLYAMGLRSGDAAIKGDDANLAFIRALLRYGPTEIGRLVENSPIELARKEYDSFYKNTSPNFRYGVCSGLLVRLNPWVNPRIAALTEVTDFDIEEMRQQLFTFYFVTSTKRPQFKPVAALAFNYVFDLLQTPGFQSPLTLFLDELTNYGYIPDLPDKLTHIRNQRIGAVIGIQHHIQLSKVYADKDAQLLLTQPGTRIYFRPRDNDSALRISRSLGNMTVKQRMVGSSGNIQETERQRPLLDPSEIERLPKTQAAALMPSTNPVLVDTFLPAEHNEFCQLPPPRRSANLAYENFGRACSGFSNSGQAEESLPEDNHRLSNSELSAKDSDPWRDDQID